MGIPGERDCAVVASCVLMSSRHQFHSDSRSITMDSMHTTPLHNLPGLEPEEFTVTYCPEHGVKVTSDLASAEHYQQCVRACITDGSTDDREHARAHMLEGTDCWVCCDRMQTPMLPMPTPDDRTACDLEFGTDHDHDPAECARILDGMAGRDVLAYLEAEQEAYSREAQEEALGRPLFPNEY